MNPARSRNTLVTFFVIKTNYLPPLCIHRVRSCRIDLEQAEMEQVNEKALGIKDCLVRSGKDGGSLCLLSAGDEIFFISHLIFKMVHLS